MMFQTVLALSFTVGLCAAQQADKPMKNEPNSSNADAQVREQKEVTIFRMAEIELAKTEKQAQGKKKAVVPETGRFLLRGPLTAPEEKVARWRFNWK